MLNPASNMQAVAAEILGQANGRLGFGCSPLYGGRTRQQSLKILQAAVAEGINYFDTARMYGDGEAEFLLGEVLPRDRSKFIITSKAGILPPRKSLPGKLFRKLNTIAHHAPGIGRIIPEPPHPQPIHPAFSSAQLRKSLEATLRGLKTDYVDIFLLHECSFVHATNPETLDLLSEFQKEGKIRTYGSATSIETTRALATRPSTLMPMLQFKSNAWEREAAALRSGGRSPFVTHTTMGPDFRGFIVRLKAEGTLRQRAIALDIDPDDNSSLAVLLLAHSLRSNPKGAVLFSTTKPLHLQATLKADQIAHDRIDDIEKLVDEDIVTRPLLVR